MAIFEIYASDDGEQVEFVRDRASIIALIFPAIWLIWNRLWFVLIGYGLISILFAGLSAADTRWALVAGLLTIIPGLYIFLEGQTLVAAKFEKNGLQFVSVLEAGNKESAELRWFSDPQNAVKSQHLGTSELPASNSNIRSANSPSQNDIPEFGIFAPE